MNAKCLLAQTGLCLLSIAGNAQEKMAEKKNVLFIMSDDFNYWLHSIGYYPQVKTPNLDKLASEGVLFANAYCSSPVSNPSRNALWSGLRPSTTGIDNNAGGFVRDRVGFEDIVTMNQYFLQNGYWVYGAGKLYHPGSMNDNPYIDKDNWSERYKGGTGSKGGKFLKWKNPGWSSMSYSVNEESMNEENCSDYEMVNEVAQYIKDYAKSAHKDQPFFIGCGVFRPHLPWNVPMDFWNMYKTEDLKIPEGCLDKVCADMPWLKTSSAHKGVLDAGKWKEAIHAYISLMTMTDSNIGILLDALASTPYKDNTIICFMGDHGWHLGEKEQWGKATLYDEANHTSLIIYDPSAQGNGKVCRKVVSLQDLYPTLVELCGLPAKADIEGNSLHALLQEPESKDWNKPVVSTYSGSNYIKTNEWRYVRSKGGDRDMLFDVVKDPSECNNLINDRKYAGVIKKLNAELDSILAIGTRLREEKLKGEKPQMSGKALAVKLGDKELKGTISRTCVKSKVVKRGRLLLDLLSSDPYCTLIIYDESGKEMLKKTVPGEQDMELELPSGMGDGSYYLFVKEHDGSSVEKFVVKGKNKKKKNK
ncbi:sulfatase [uncultured Bacteroides sp.]|uniref:sulfatase n=1 Tax=uncultured Bacteroides sp. TaxID=162156 RepID=UPI002587B022|nr:sulfatase [uncultured Bacteroides sp.]